MKRFVMGALGVTLPALVVWQPTVHAQPVASIALPAPGDTVQLYPGCNNVSLTFPDGTASETVVEAVTPAGLFETLWRHNAALSRFEGFSPAAPQASDLLAVNFLDAVWLCLAAGPTPPTPQPTPEPQTLSEADAGTTVMVLMHDTIKVVLEGNPTTGFTWERAPDDESAVILEQLGDPEFQPSTGLAGSGGEFTFRFEGVASGQAVLKLIYHRPWEAGVPPEKTFEVTVWVPSPSV
jgi:inhibitor of cysteine peptidase